MKLGGPITKGYIGLRTTSGILAVSLLAVVAIEPFLLLFWFVFEEHWLQPWWVFAFLQSQSVRLRVVMEYLRTFFREELGAIPKQKRWLQVFRNYNIA